MISILIGMYECLTLHSSEHCLNMIPGWGNRTLIAFKRLGTASHLTNAAGKEKACNTSLDVI